jgi:hypothetical protein
MFCSSFTIRAIGVPALLLLGNTMKVDAAPPPDATGQYHDWFQSLTVPGLPMVTCCNVSDCRMVESRWNNQTQHYEARVVRNTFSNALRTSPLYENNVAALQKARRIWISDWIAAYGDVPATWIEIPDARINLSNNPTGHAVLCWSAFYPDFNGVFCFIPYQGV